MKTWDYADSPVGKVPANVRTFIWTEAKVAAHVCNAGARGWAGWGSFGLCSYQPRVLL